ncbi:MAG: hypothetical protein AB1665_06125 [Candidatus Thermoplasmatota archaeon]
MNDRKSGYQPEIRNGSNSSIGIKKIYVLYYKGYILIFSLLLLLAMIGFYWISLVVIKHGDLGGLGMAITLTIPLGMAVFDLILSLTNKIPKETPESLINKNSMIGTITIIYAIVTFVALGWYMVLSYFGISPTIPAEYDTMEWWESAYGGITGAAIEEFIFRLLMIGGLLYLIGYLMKREYLIMRLMSDKIKKLNKIEWTIVLFSALIFSLLHILSWDIFKIFPVFIAWVGLGYIFTSRGWFKGFVSSFTLHFVNNSGWTVYCLLWYLWKTIAQYHFILDLILWICLPGYVILYFISSKRERNCAIED